MEKKDKKEKLQLKKEVLKDLKVNKTNVKAGTLVAYTNICNINQPVQPLEPKGTLTNGGGGISSHTIC